MSLRRRRFSAGAAAAANRYKLGTPVQGRTIELDVAGAETDGPKWQHVATEGTYKGYLGGTQPFVFDLKIFQQIVKNFQASPSYKPGPGGLGSSGVVQWDFHHASEEPASSGDIATVGAPAQGWVFDVKIVQGPVGAELWALTEWLDPAKTYIQQKKYKWASVAVALDCVDKITGEQIGAVLTSIAITNAPFIEGMNDLAASAKEGAAPPAPAPVQGELLRAVREEPGVKNAYRAYNLDEALSQCRRELGLPITATLEEIQQGLIDLFAAVTSPDPTVGPAVQKAITNIKEILGLPLLADTAMVAEHVMRLFEEAAPPTEIDPTAASAAAATTEPVAASAKKHKPSITATSKDIEGESVMTPEELLALAKKLGVQPTTAAVARACASLMAVKLALVGALGVNADIADERLEESATNVKKFADGHRALLAAVDLLAKKHKLSAKKRVALKAKAAEPPVDEDDETKAKASREALVGKLGALFKAAGVEDADTKIAQIASTMQAASELEDVMPELAALKKATEATEAKAESDTVGAALSTHFGGDEKKRALLTSHYRNVGAAAFLEEYPVEAAPDLTTVLFANPTGRGAGEAPPATRVQATAPRTAPTTRPDVVDIGMYPGANDTERAINAYRSTVQGADKLSYDDVFELACQQKNTGRFVNLSAQRHGAAARG